MITHILLVTKNVLVIFCAPHDVTNTNSEYFRSLAFLHLTRPLFSYYLYSTHVDIILHIGGTSQKLFQGTMTI